ncbi:MAG: hypothetical protein CSA81_03840 [Acidobacteria bacterium]|nr:MAG: hypothetical protein CSA81_03840 [Acidobacteriota bacterium]
MKFSRTLMLMLMFINTLIPALKEAHNHSFHCCCPVQTDEMAFSALDYEEVDSEFCPACQILRSWQTSIWFFFSLETVELEPVAFLHAIYCCSSLFYLPNYSRGPPSLFGFN